MSNFVRTFKAGKEGRNFGLPTGIPALDKVINGLQREMSIGLAAAAKCGKTTLCDFCFLLNPYLHMLEKKLLHNIRWIYFSYEISRISKEFKLAAFFMYNDYGIFDYMYKGVRYRLDDNYLMGKKVHRNKDGTEEQIPITPAHEEKLKEIYVNRIVPLFGEFDAETGKKVSQGKIEFIEMPENPTGLYNYLLSYAGKNGNFVEEEYTMLDDKGRPIKKKRKIGYKPANPDLYTIIIVDHIRKLRPERGFQLKQTIDKWLEYNTELRNLCKFTFVNVCHSNRGMANVERLKFHQDWIFPTADDVKDTGNLAEESTVLLTMMNPHDEKYNLKTHMKVPLKDYPHYRSLHVTDSRNSDSTDLPAHIQLNMFGGVNLFQPIVI